MPGTATINFDHVSGRTTTNVRSSKNIVTNCAPRLNVHPFHYPCRLCLLPSIHPIQSNSKVTQSTEPASAPEVPNCKPSAHAHNHMRKRSAKYGGNDTTYARTTERGFISFYFDLCISLQICCKNSTFCVLQQRQPGLVVQQRMMRRKKKIRKIVFEFFVFCLVAKVTRQMLCFTFFPYFNKCIACDWCYCCCCCCIWRDLMVVAMMMMFLMHSLDVYYSISLFKFPCFFLKIWKNAG